MPKAKPAGIKPFWMTKDSNLVRLYLGDVNKVLAALPAKSVHCVVTSPPYWGLRDYGTGTWEGGNMNCDHKMLPLDAAKRSGLLSSAEFNDEGYTTGKTQPNSAAYKGVCGKCGAKRIDAQIGSEPSPDCGTHGKAQCGACFVCSMVSVFSEVWRVLRDDGTLWLNLGDTYGLPPGNLVGVPWRVALALQANGWVLRQDIIWSKPSPMPESVINRCTKAHEYVFLLTKSKYYYYDAEAIKEKSSLSDKIGGSVGGAKYSENDAGSGPQSGNDYLPSGKSNKRSVWTVASQGYAGAHFATFPPNLIEPMIKAGTSERGACANCGAPWRRVVNKEKLTRDCPNDYVKRTGEIGTGSFCANSVAGVKVSTIGWEPTCECHGELRTVKTKKLKTSPQTFESKAGTDDNEYLDVQIRGKSGKDHTACQAAEHEDKDYRKITEVRYVSNLPLDEHPVVPSLVLDPFIGSGTTIAVSLKNGRRCWGIDLNERYLRDNAIPRIEGVLLETPDLANQVCREHKILAVGKRLNINQKEKT